MRHGSRDLSGSDRLAAEGREQAMQLSRDIQEGRLPRPTRLIATPRVRSQETLHFVAVALSLSIEADPQCDERQPAEKVAEFEARVRMWTENARLSAAGSCTLVVSHLDWLEAAALFLNSDETELERAERWTPAARRYYFYQDGIWQRRLR